MHSATVNFYRIKNGEYTQISSYYHPSNGQFSGIGTEVADFARVAEYDMHCLMGYDDLYITNIDAVKVSKEYATRMKDKYPDMQSSKEEVTPYIYSVLIDETDCAIDVEVKQIDVDTKAKRVQFTGPPEETCYFLYRCNN